MTASFIAVHMFIFMWQSPLTTPVITNKDVGMSLESLFEPGLDLSASQLKFDPIFNFYLNFTIFSIESMIILVNVNEIWIKCIQHWNNS